MLFFPLPGIFFRYPCDVYRITNRSSKLEHELVDVTPTPVFTRLEGLDNGVVGRVKMLGGMLILRIVTATDMPAFETEAQGNPAISNLQTILTAICPRVNFFYLITIHTTP